MGTLLRQQQQWMEPQQKWRPDQQRRQEASSLTAVIEDTTIIARKMADIIGTRGQGYQRDCRGAGQWRWGDLRGAARSSRQTRGGQPESRGEESEEGWWLSGPAPGLERIGIPCSIGGTGRTSGLRIITVLRHILGPPGVRHHTQQQMRHQCRSHHHQLLQHREGPAGPDGGGAMQRTCSGRQVKAPDLAVSPRGTALAASAGSRRPPAHDHWRADNKGLLRKPVLGLGRVSTAEE